MNDLGYRDVPIGTGATGVRTESDAMGEVDVPAEHYWGAQTQRALRHFAIGDRRMPPGLCRAYGLVKLAAAQSHEEAGRLDPPLARAIVRAAEEVADGALDAEFPLLVWQSGSGTQTNMNVNEVIANRAIQLLGGRLGAKAPVHPNDHVNMGQSTNDTFPTAMHVATVVAVEDLLLPELAALGTAIDERARRWASVVKIGRTHLQDATPLTVGQEWSGWSAQLGDAARRVEQSLDGVRRLAIGGTAVGTGLNAPEGFAAAVVERLADRTGRPFSLAPNPFAALAALDDMVAVSGALRGVAVALMKLANDTRWLGSGPRAGLGELRLPENEPGSSIMPGKVNPSQQEAAVMVCTQVLALDAAVASAGAQGSFQLNTMRPLVIADVSESIQLLGDVCRCLRTESIEGIELHESRIADLVGRSLMLVTALSPHIGYDRASAIAHDAHARDVTLRDAAMAAGVDAALFDRVVDPSAMVGDPLT